MTEKGQQSVITGSNKAKLLALLDSTNLPPRPFLCFYINMLTSTVTVILDIQYIFNIFNIQYIQYSIYSIYSIFNIFNIQVHRVPCTLEHAVPCSIIHTIKLRVLSKCHVMHNVLRGVC